MLVKNKLKGFIILNFLKFYLTNGNKEISENIIKHSLSILKKIKKQTLLVLFLRVLKS